MSGDSGHPTPAIPRAISRLSEVAETYGGFIIDLWGTLHDGVTAYPLAIDVLRRLRARGASICLLSNAARSAATLGLKLRELGIGPECYDHLVSSGQATIDAFRHPDEWHDALGRRYYLFAPDDGEPLLTDSVYIRVTEPRAADFVLNTGSVPGTELGQHEPALRACARQKLPMVCANPDLFVRIAGRAILCAGAIARRYVVLGGQVRYHGKPQPEIYQTCLNRMNLTAQAVLAIGDGLETDIAGAQTARIASVFVVGGLHATCLDESPGRLQQLLGRSNSTPTCVIPYLRW